MNTKQLVTAVATKTGLTMNAAEDAVKAVLELVTTEVGAGEKVILAGFGTFEARDRAPRNGRNPQTGEMIAIAASRAPAFKPAAGFRQRVQHADSRSSGL